MILIGTVAGPFAGVRGGRNVVGRPVFNADVNRMMYQLTGISATTIRPWESQVALGRINAKRVQVGRESSITQLHVESL